MKSFRRLVIGAATVASAASGAQAVYWDVFGGQVSTYQFNDNNLNFVTAEQQARIVNQNALVPRTFLGAQGNMATISSTPENQLVTLLGRNRGTKWLGITDDALFAGTANFHNTSVSPLPPAGQTPANTAGTQRGEGFVWVSGQDLVFQNFNGGEPNNSGGSLANNTENFGELSNTGGWNDNTSLTTISYAGGSGNLRRSVIEFNPVNAPSSQWQVTSYKVQDVQTAGVGVGNLSEARQVVAGTRGPLQPTFGTAGVATGNVAVLNFGQNTNDPNNGLFRQTATAGQGQVGGFAAQGLPGFGTGSQDNYTVLSTGSFSVLTGQDYTFGVNSDDGFGLRIFNSGGGTVAFTSAFGDLTTAIGTGSGVLPGELAFTGGRGNFSIGTTTDANNQPSYGVLNLAPGNYSFELINWEGNGGYGLEAFWKAGGFTDTNGNAVIDNGIDTVFDGKGFQLIGVSSADLTWTSPIDVSVRKLFNQVNFADVNNITDANAVIAGTFSAPLQDLNPFVAGNNAVTGFTNVINMIDGNTNVAGIFGIGANGAETNLLNDTPLGLGGMDDFVIEATGFVKITATGIWTFGISANDGYQLLLDLDNNGSYETNVVTRASNVNNNPAFTNILLNEGIYGIRYVAFDRSGDWGNELYAAFNPLGSTITSVSQLSFALVGDAENGGLRVAQSIAALAVVVPEPATGLLGLLGLTFLARRRNRANA